ncbi:MAG: hypothetical protein MJ215_06595 [Spirochaetia bacterium]|nr:hypothetical protein [Spirochaetia bacterium]
MRRNIYVGVFSWTVVGLIVGYLIFGKLNGELISLETLCFPADNALERMAHRLADLNAIRLKITGCGLAGFAFGFITGKLRKR